MQSRTTAIMGSLSPLLLILAAGLLTLTFSSSPSHAFIAVQPDVGIVHHSDLRRYSATTTTTLHLQGFSFFGSNDNKKKQNQSTTNAGGRVLVIGGTSGIGQLVTEKLISNEKRPVRVTCRNKENGQELLPKAEIVALDLLNTDTNDLEQAMDGVSQVVISVGTTAFPTMKWKGGNTPQAIDDDAVTRIAKVLSSKSSSIGKIVLVTSVGVERTGQMPFLILNLFGVLDAKKAGEQAIANTGIPYAIVRPGRLVGGPFTNLDVAKLLQIQGGAENGVDLARGDDLLGDCKRDACAECIVQILKNPNIRNLEFSVVSNEEKAALNDDEWTKALEQVAVVPSSSVA